MSPAITGVPSETTPLDAETVTTDKTERDRQPTKMRIALSSSRVALRRFSRPSGQTSQIVSHSRRSQWDARPAERRHRPTQRRPPGTENRTPLLIKALATPATTTTPTKSWAVPNVSISVYSIRTLATERISLFRGERGACAWAPFGSEKMCTNI